MNVSLGADWTLITVTYNSARVLRAAWESADFGGARWIVVDNASSDDSVEVAKDLGADVVALSHNRGFSRANNVGLTGVSTPWVGFVNPDVTVRGAKDLERLARISTANGRALVAPQLVNRDGTEQPNGRGLPYLLDKFAHRGIRLPGSKVNEYARIGLQSPTYVAWAMGAALAGPTDVVRRLGGWDERYFLYYEDHDLGLRAWMNGVSVVLDPEVRWPHDWKRATANLSVAPWRHEVRSATTFFATYPDLLRLRRRVEQRWPTVVARLWRAARDA